MSVSTTRFYVIGFGALMLFDTWTQVSFKLAANQTGEVTLTLEWLKAAVSSPWIYAAVAGYLKRTRGLGSIDIPSPYHSTWMDNSKAKFELGWRPRFDLAKLIDAAWNYERPKDDPRKVWYPG